MSQYTKQQMGLIKLVLLRPLKAGEQFKVSNPLTPNNTVPSMEESEGKWVTVTKSRREEDDDNYGYFDPIYEKLELPIFVYHIKEDLSIGNGTQYVWLDYHMDIHATNLRILEVDRISVSLVKQEPQLPTI